MENEDLRTVRVYTKKYNSKDSDGNTVEKESKQKQVSLKKEDPFEDDDLVMVLAKEDYEKLIGDSRRGDLRGFSADGAGDQRLSGGKDLGRYSGGDDEADPSGGAQ